MTKTKKNSLNINTSVGIMGCGWLGTALAQCLLNDNIEVFATVTSIEKQKVLKNLSINSEQVQLPTSVNELKNKHVFKQAQLVICITPQLKYGKKDYALKIKNIISAANNGQVEHIILISTSAVYGNLIGNISEDAVLDLNNEKVQALVNAEQALEDFLGAKTILRLTGLVGEDRHPGRFLAGKTALSNANAAVNIIHQQDAVGILRCLLINRSKSQKTEIFNACCNTHITRKEFYQKAAKAINLTPPTFLPDTKQSKRKIIVAKKIQNKHNYQFVYPELLMWLEKAT